MPGVPGTFQLFRKYRRFRGLAIGVKRLWMLLGARQETVGYRGRKCGVFSGIRLENTSGGSCKPLGGVEAEGKP